VRSSGLYRALAAVAIASVATGMLMVTAGAAWSAPKARTPRPPRMVSSAPSTGTGEIMPSPVAPNQRGYSHAVLRFNVAAAEAVLTLPTPPCPVAEPGCVWRLIINEPKAPGAPVVGSVTGTSGVLTLPFPAYCGVIQADAQIGPVWVQRNGIRHKIDNCVTPPTTSTTASTSTTTTSTTVVKQPVVSATSTTPTTSAALPFTAATTAATTAKPATVAAAQLPFTGLDIRPMILVGAALVLFGGLLLTTVESRRRALRRASAIRLEHLKEGSRRTSSWFLGQ